MNNYNIFTHHPHSVGDTYGQHFVFAAKNGIILCVAGVASLIHSIFPFLCTRTASQIVDIVNKNLIAKQNVSVHVSGGDLTKR